MCDIEVMGAPPDISYGSYRLGEFTALWVEAGSPSAEAIAQGLKERLLREEVNRWVGWLKARQPVSEAVRKAIEKIKNQGLGVPAATLRGWIKAPRRVPSSDAQLMQVVAFLSIRAVQRGERAKYVVSPAEFDRWAALRQGAWEARKRSGAGDEARQADAGGSDVRGQQFPSRLIEPVGQPVSDFNDADVVEVLKVHRAIEIADDDGETSLSVLPRYLVREVDAVLRDRLRAVEESKAGLLVVLVGDSATGKSRAAWEAINAELTGWRLCHDLTPGHCSAEVAMAVVESRVAPRTVVWLGDAQNFLEPATEGPALADALTKLLALPGPRIVLATIWPAPFERLTHRSVVPHAAVGDLLRGRAIRMPSDFTQSDLVRGDNPSVMAKDRRLQRAAARAVDGEIVQALAGVPEIKSRYQSASPTETAILWAAADAHRLSARWRVLSSAFLFKAAPGYLRKQEWRRAQPWNAAFDAALDSLTAEARGISGLLMPHVPRPVQDGPGGFELTDVLEEELVRDRFSTFPPADFWDSAAAASSNEPVCCSIWCRRIQARSLQAGVPTVPEASRWFGALGGDARVAQRSWREGDEPSARSWAHRAAEGGDGGALFGLLASLQADAGHWNEAEQFAWDASHSGNHDALLEVLFRCAMAATADTRRRMKERTAQITDASAILRDTVEEMAVAKLLIRWATDGTAAMPDGKETRLSPRLLDLVASDDKQFAERLHKRLWSEKWRK